MQHDISLSYDEFILKFKDMIKSLGLNNSVQREYLLKILFQSKEHLNAEELLHQVKTTYNVNIGIATVYRILNLLEDLNIVKSISISGQDFKVYELSLKPHHDHMVCVKCNSCGKQQNIELNRRVSSTSRTKAVNQEACITTDRGSYLVEIEDYGFGGIGLIVREQLIVKIQLKVGDRVTVSFSFHCGKYKGKFIVRSINGNRVGLEHNDGQLLSPNQRIIKCNNKGDK